MREKARHDVEAQGEAREEVEEIWNSHPSTIPSETTVGYQRRKPSLMSKTNVGEARNLKGRNHHWVSPRTSRALLTEHTWCRVTTRKCARSVLPIIRVVQRGLSHTICYYSSGERRELQGAQGYDHAMQVLIIRELHQEQQWNQLNQVPRHIILVMASRNYMVQHHQETDTASSPIRIQARTAGRRSQKM